MRVLVGFEFSGRVRDAFLKKGHDAWSCDLLPSESKGPHYQMDIWRALGKGYWDLFIAHPPCTHLASSGARWWKFKSEQQDDAIRLVKSLMMVDILKIAIENPVGILSSQYRKPDQIIHPWQFGHGETKATCLWLQSLPKLNPTDIVSGREHRIHKMPPSENRWKDRSRTFYGIAKAMADQWG